MQIRNFTTTTSGPVVEIDGPPLDHTGTPYLSAELAQLLQPYMRDRDNIGISFKGRLQTTMTAVMTEMYIFLDTSTNIVRWYSVRAMIFASLNDRIAINVDFQPIRTEFVDVRVSQSISNGYVYNFRGLYGGVDECLSDLERILRHAHIECSSH